LGEVLEPGWFRDRLATRPAPRGGDQDLLTAAPAAQAERSGRLLPRMRPAPAGELVLIGGGTLPLRRVVVRRRGPRPTRPVVLPPPGRGGTGVLGLLWGGAMGAIIILASSFVPDRACSRILIGATTNLSFVPLVFLAWLFLLRPSGLRLIRSFGLVPAVGLG